MVCGPAHVAHHATSGTPVVALSLLPMAARFRTALPPGVIDFSEVVWGQPDLFVPTDPPEPGDLAWVDPSGAWSQQELLAEAVGVPGRILTEVTADLAGRPQRVPRPAAVRRRHRLGASR